MQLQNEDPDLDEREEESEEDEDEEAYEIEYTQSSTSNGNQQYHGPLFAAYTDDQSSSPEPPSNDQQSLSSLSKPRQAARWGPESQQHPSTFSRRKKYMDQEAIDALGTSEDEDSDNENEKDRDARLDHERLLDEEHTNNFLETGDEEVEGQVGEDEDGGEEEEQDEEEQDEEEQSGEGSDAIVLLISD